ncbi:MAG: hypothetical protein V4727_09690 [Verrucomicrobiota bacterium]
MPDSNSEPEKYTIDEMLDRLKSRGDGEGELVTRADGTKAIKVRKRKRRTDQTKDKLKAQNHRLQLIQIAGFIIFMVVMLIIGGVMILYSNSSAFREGLITKVQNASGSETKLQQFRMNPATASAARLDMDWPEAHALNRLEATTLKAKISPISFIGKVFQGQEIVAAKGNLFLTAPQSQDDSAAKATGDKRIKFSRYSVTSLNVFFSEEMAGDRMIENVEASYLPTKTSKGGEIRLIKGLLKMKGWPSLALDRSYIQVGERELDIKSMRFQIPLMENQKIPDKGSMDLSGVIRPLDHGATHQLMVNLDSFQISHLLGSGLGRFFHGKTITKPEDTSNTLQFTPGSGQDALLKLNITNALDSRVSLSQFKFMGQLAFALDDRWYELPSFDDEVKISMKKSGHLVELEEIYFEQRTRMALKGSVTIKDEAGNISGSLSVGIPEIIIAASKNRKLEGLFSPVKDGYRWIDLKLSGTSAAPVDNFKELYQADPITSKPELKTDPKPEGVDSFDSLIKPE